MLNSVLQKKIFDSMKGCIALTLLFILVACMPQAQQSSIKSSNSSSPGKNPVPADNSYPAPTFPLQGSFLQQSGTQTQSILTLGLNFNDSFMVRGKELSEYLSKLPNTTKFCLVGKYTYNASKDKFLLLAAKPVSYTDTVKKTKEHYLLVAPADSGANQNDCLVYNLTNELLSNAFNGSVHFSLTDLCTDCSTSVTSAGLKLYSINGQEVPGINLSPLSLSISGNSGGTPGNSCSESSACRARGFSCCLNGQCIMDGAPKPVLDPTDPAYLSAKQDVTSNPSRFVLYPQYYFVCDSRPDGGTGGSTGGNNGGKDPLYEAQIRLMELSHLYQCLNKVNGEFSYCTTKIEDASQFSPKRFSAAVDDVNFSELNSNLKTGVYANNIVKVVYAGSTLFEFEKTPLKNVSFVVNTFNDNLDDAQEIDLTAPVSQNAPDDNLYITYKTDGTCEKIGSTLGRCTKTYIQNAGTDQKFTTTWHDATNEYSLPAYADLSKAIIVKLGGIVLTDEPSNWQIIYSPKPGVRILKTPFQNQKVEITYFISGDDVQKVMASKLVAQEKVNSLCSCGTGSCNLRPIYDENNALTNYECVYPAPSSSEPPPNQTVSVSSKNVPHRYFDTNGVNYDDETGAAPPQEFAEFNYTANNTLDPNNVNSYVGFNEIYGSFLKNGPYARPAKMVRVKKDQYYDLFVSTGSFSSCSSCGSDYYNALQKIFPDSFSVGGGGYTPDLYESSRERNQSNYRSDDLLFGRACFVPATMIPWTHTAGDPNFQRKNRLAAQHFLFANGYNRDWYGFDYGSLIGSFDGVTWFSIGNKRRIKAKGQRLYLAVNAYYGDLSIDNSITVNVSETVNFANTSFPEHDTLSEGAQCQKSHYCSNDNDCIKQLGYEYSCQNVAALTSNWPTFDANGSEAGSDPVSMRRSIASLVGGTNGQAKRCVYRGRGAPCDTDLSKSDPSSYFNGSVSAGSLTCAPNYSCQPLTSSRFNTKISRFGNTPANQNLIEAAGTNNDSDLVGLAARILGRPFNFYGTEAPPTPVGLSSVRNTLNANNVSAICVPGKDVMGSTTTYTLNNRYPTSTIDSSDKLFGVGTTLSRNVINEKYLNACPATTPQGNFLHHINSNLTGNEELTAAAISQNLSSNLLDLAPLNALEIFNTTNGSQIQKVGYQRNSCLRAPGASCFTDMECAPSENIAAKARAANFAGILNPAEEKYWEEELVCGNPDFKMVNNGALNPNYDIKKNRCCREMGKELTVSTQKNDGNGANDFRWCDGVTQKPLVAGVNTSVTDRKRYSRVHTAYDKMTCNPDEVTSAKTFALSTFNADKELALTQILRQYKTLDTLNSRTCCTTHWVRQYASSNGGGTKFSRSKLQTVDKAMFKHVSWLGDNNSLGVVDAPFECDPDNYANSSCEVKSLTPAEEEKYLRWASSLELIGIPQVAIATNDQIFKLVDDNQETLAPGTNVPLNKSVVPSSPANADFIDGSGYNYYSGASYNKFVGLKQVFSEDKFNCCVPSGQQVPDYMNPEQCCTGYIGDINNIKRCCLPDFTDLTVYLNRYVSSEGRDLLDSAYDPMTGYIKDPGQVKLIAQQKNLCCSGRIMTGVAISQLSIPITGDRYLPADSLSTSRRFNYRSDEVDNNPETGNVGAIFDAGVRWNNHVYCVPQGFGQ